MKNIKELKLKLSQQLDEIDDLFPSRQKPVSVRVNIDNAKAIFKAKKSTEKDFQQEVDIFQSIIDKKKKADQEEQDQLIKKLNEEEKKHEEQVNEALKDPKNIEADTLKRLAKNPPDPNTRKNIFRPDWTVYNTSNNSWQLDANKLADEIADDQLVRRIEEKGKVVNYSRYNYMLGQWEIIAPDDLGNFIDKYFKDPDKYQHASNNMYAEDLHTAKAVRDTLTLLKSKIKKIDQTITFDQPPKYIVHCKDYDFDVLNWKKVSFSPKHYFISGLAFDIDENMLKAYTTSKSLEKNAKSKEIAEEAKKTTQELIETIAPVTQKWLASSLQDKETAKAMIERLGLSMLHTYEDNFIVFVQSLGGGIGKSKLFNYLKSLFQQSDVTALDLDQMAEKGSFDAQELRQHDINLTGEIKTTNLNRTVLNVLERLSGNDFTQLPQKFLGTADFTNFDHLWFNMNHLPRLGEYDDAVARRMDVFKWHKISNFDEMEKDVMNERPQMILLAMIYAHDTLTRSRKPVPYCSADLRITRSELMVKSYQEWAGDNDFFKNFIDEKCNRGADYKIGMGYFLKQFNDYIHIDQGETSFRNYHKNEFSDMLENIGIYRSEKPNCWTDPNTYQTKHGVYVYEGITIKSNTELKDEARKFDQDQKEAGEKEKAGMYARDDQRWKAQQKGIRNDR